MFFFFLHEHNNAHLLRAATEYRAQLQLPCHWSKPLATTLHKTQTRELLNAFCGIKIKDAGSTTSNFVRHLKTHWIGESLGNVEINVSADGRLANMFSSASAT